MKPNKQAEGIKNLILSESKRFWYLGGLTRSRFENPEALGKKLQKIGSFLEGKGYGLREHLPSSYRNDVLLSFDTLGGNGKVIDRRPPFYDSNMALITENRIYSTYDFSQYWAGRCTSSLGYVKGNKYLEKNNFSHFSEIDKVSKLGEILGQIDEFDFSYDALIRKYACGEGRYGVHGHYPSHKIEFILGRDRFPSLVKRNGKEELFSPFKDSDAIIFKIIPKKYGTEKSFEDGGIYTHLPRACLCDLKLIARFGEKAKANLFEAINHASQKEA